MVLNRFSAVLGLLLIAKGVFKDLQGVLCMCSRESAGPLSC